MTQTPSSSKKLFKPMKKPTKPTKPMKKLTKPTQKPMKKPTQKPMKRSAGPIKEPTRLAEIVIKPKTNQATIDIARTNIEYTEGLSERAGFLKITAGSPAIVPPNADTLLHLLFFLIYTAEGAQLLSANSLSSSSTPDVARAKLKVSLKLKFPTLGDDRLDAVIDAHFAADGYVSALQANDDAKRQAQQEIYSQRLLAILGELHDDAMGHEFSMRW